jgi:site-specific recombinase XerD
MSGLETQMALKGSPATTIKSYARGLRDVMLSLQCPPEMSTAEAIKAHFVELRDERSLSSSALNTRVCGVKLYLKEVVKRPDLVVDIPNPRVQKYITEVLTEQEMEKLFGCCGDMRQLAVLYLLYDTGIRVREAVNLRPCDFDKVSRSLTVRNGKGQKLRVVPYGSNLRQTLIRHYQNTEPKPTHWLIESYVGEHLPLSTRGIQHIVREVVKRSGLKKDIHPHTFRHTYAVHYLNNGGNLLLLQRHLGHQHLSTTLHYLKYGSIPLLDIASPLDCLMARKGKKP